MKILYVTTWELHYVDPDLQYLDVNKNTVCGVFHTRLEAVKKMIEVATSPLFESVYNKAIETNDGIVIDIPDYMHAEFHVHEHRMED